MVERKIFFNKLYKLSERAYNNNYVPISALVVDKNGKIVSVGYNKTKKNVITSHAEIYALNKACKKMRTNKLQDCSVWVTVEPCMMCLGAIINSGIKAINYYLINVKFGFVKSNHTFDLTKMKIRKITNEDENIKLQSLMKDFFLQLR